MGGNGNRADWEKGNGNAVLEWELVGIKVIGKMGMGMQCYNGNGWE